MRGKHPNQNQRNDLIRVVSRSNKDNQETEQTKEMQHLKRLLIWRIGGPWVSTRRVWSRTRPGKSRSDTDAATPSQSPRC